MKFSFAIPMYLLSLALAMTSAGAQKPNIIYILADDLGYGDLGCYGQKIIKTPNLDRMCAQGMKFTDHHAGSTVCAPSRFTLMTGLHIGHSRSIGQGQQLIDSDITVAKVLKSAGYATACIGKWGLGEKTGHPNKQGFDLFYGFLNQRRAHFYYPDYLWRNTEKVEFKDNFTKKDNYSHDHMAAEALAFVEANKDKPFFLYLPFTIPHAELAVPDDSLNQYKGKIKEVAKGPITKPYSMKGYNPNRFPHAAFAGMVTRMDRDIGRLFALLKELKIDDNTLVFFASDNGPHHEGGADPDFFGSRGPLRGIKRDLYEGGIRVPFFARWPGKIKAGSISHHTSAFWDMLPTFAEIAGVECPKKTDGISLLPELLGKEQKKHDYLFWDFGEKGGKTAVRIGKWKGVRLNTRKNPNGPIELYDVSQDIGEKKNIAGQHPEIIDRIGKIMAELAVSQKVKPKKKGKKKPRKKK